MHEIFYSLPKFAYLNFSFWESYSRAGLSQSPQTSRYEFFFLELVRARCSRVSCLRAFSVRSLHHLTSSLFFLLESQDLLQRFVKDQERLFCFVESNRRILLIHRQVFKEGPAQYVQQVGDPLRVNQTTSELVVKTVLVYTAIKMVCSTFHCVGAAAGSLGEAVQV